MENSVTPGTTAPSVSALTAAAARAAHLIVDEQPLIFSDSLAATLLGDRAGELLAYHRMNGSHHVLVGGRARWWPPGSGTVPTPCGRPACSSWPMPGSAWRHDQLGQRAYGEIHPPRRAR
jgi:hypothetical protein